jgi:hypothetical protein
LVANKSIRFVDKRIQLLSATRNIETLIKIEEKAILVEICRLTTVAVPFEHIVNKLTVVTDASEENIVAYLIKLIDQGVLHIDYGVSGLDPKWAEKFGDRISAIDASEIKQIQAFLTDLINTKGVFTGGTYQSRMDCLEHAFKQMVTLCLNFPYISNTDEIPESSKEKILSSFGIKKENIFFEDVIANRQTQLKVNTLQRVETTLNKLAGLLTTTNYRKAEKNNIIEFYKANYSGEQKVPLLSFYENYYKNSKIAAIKENHRNKFFPVDKAFADALADVSMKVFTKLSESLNLDSPIVKVDSSLLETIQSDSCKRKSFAFYFHLLNESDAEEKVVINALGAGNGSHFSRFLDYFDKEVTSNIISCNINENKHDDAILAEVADGSSFNANIRPNLFPFEIVIPDGNPVSLPASQLEVSDFYITKEQENDELQLIHQPTGKRTYIYDTCFQSFIGRSNLFNLLATFNADSFLSFNLITDSINNLIYTKNHMGEGNGLSYYPRIELDGIMIIQRAFWLIDLNRWPVKLDTDLHFFTELNLWRIKNNVPVEVFYTIVGNKSDLLLKGESVNDHSKPQYLNFSQIHSVLLFKKNLQHINNILTMTEMLPTSEMLHGAETEFGLVTEFVVQSNAN